MESGRRLAQEVKAFVRQACSEVEIVKMSFVGFSMGGLIIRAALPYLAEYRRKFFTFLTLSSPHLGFSKSESSSVVSYGLWALKKSTKSIALSQLTLTDHPSFEETCLYKLSLMPCLEWFE